MNMDNIYITLCLCHDVKSKVVQSLGDNNFSN